MAYSMTGFGKGVFEDENYLITVEMKSVNSRYCDVLIKLPRNLNEIEDRIRKLIMNSVSRGKIDVYVTFISLKESSKTLVVDEDLCKQYFDALQTISDTCGIEDNSTASVIARFPDVITAKSVDLDIEKVWNSLKVCIERALQNFLLMRKTEGDAMLDDVLNRNEKIAELLELIEERAPSAVIEYKEKLSKRLNDLVDKNIQIDENRLAQEVAIFADKCAIDEEIVRLKSHISQLKSIAKLNQPIGRKLDFLIQEFNREANTIGSKSNDSEITATMLNIKNEIEKIREQIQNIE